MFIRKISINQFKVLEDISITFEGKQNHNVFPVISANGGGKSTLLQFIFSFLHCAFKENRRIYLNNILKYYELKKNDGICRRIVEFELEYQGEVVNLEFLYCGNGYKNLNFNSILDLKEIKEKKAALENAVSDIELLDRLQHDLSKSDITLPLVWRELRKFRKNMLEEKIYVTNDAKQTLDFIQATRKKIEDSFISDDELNSLMIKAEAQKKKLDSELEKETLRYAFHFNSNADVLLYKSNATEEILNEISEKIYLAVPNTQVLHFFNESQLSSLFTNEKYLYSSYENSVKECQKDVKGLFAYDFSVIGLIIDAFQKAKDHDFKEALNTGKYGNQITQTRDELNSLLNGKSIMINDDFKSVTFKTTSSNLILSPKDLSYGELKKLSIYIWLKAKTSDNSVILMDEVDTGLHPTWQHELCNDLQKWGTGSQFILATHSPQIISHAYYKNLVVLKSINLGEGVIAEQFNEAPLESDLNTIVKTIMGGEYIPKELATLRVKYRNLFEQDKLETEEAKEIKEQILTYESENSSFFQDIKFQIELR